MTEQRIPQPGEVWTSPGDTSTYLALAATPDAAGRYPFTLVGFGVFVDLRRLIPPAPVRPELPHIEERWVNVYENANIGGGVDERQVDTIAAPGRIARVPLEPNYDRVVWCDGPNVLEDQT